MVTARRRGGVCEQVQRMSQAMELWEIARRDYLRAQPIPSYFFMLSPLALSHCSDRALFVTGGGVSPQLIYGMQLRALCVIIESL